MRYSTYFTAAQAGQIATSSSRDTITMPNDVTPLDFGVPVTIKNTTTVGSNPVVIKGGSEDDVIGVSIFKQPTEAVLNGASVVYKYKPNEPVGIITDGCIYVIASVDVSAFDAAYIDVDGKFTNISTNNARFGKFVTQAKAGEIAVLEFDISTYNISNSPIVTPSGELILPNQDETYDDTAGESGEIFYDTTNKNIKAFTGGAWHTIVTDKDDLIALNHTDVPTTHGIIYYNNNLLRTHDNSNTLTIVTTPDPNGHLVAKSTASSPTTPGIIYYRSNLLRTHDSTSTQTIFTTPDPNGHLVVKSRADHIYVPPTPGLIYYNSSQETFMGYTSGTNKIYLGPKQPTIAYSDSTSTSEDPGAEATKYETVLAGNAPKVLYAYDTSSHAGREIRNYNFLFEPHTYNGTKCDGFKYIGEYDISSTVMVSITGYYTGSSNDTTIEFYAENEEGNITGGSIVSMNLRDHNAKATVTMIFNMVFHYTDYFRIFARHTSSSNDINFYTTNFSVRSITF